VRQAVVDASVAVKWVVEEEHSVMAVNVLWSKVFRGDVSAADFEERMTVLLRAPVIGTPIAELMARAFAIPDPPTIEAISRRAA
jgi:predicted nucleic acid-binding protein